MRDTLSGYSIIISICLSGLTIKGADRLGHTPQKEEGSGRSTLPPADYDRIVLSARSPLAPCLPHNLFGPSRETVLSFRVRTRYFSSNRYLLNFLLPLNRPIRHARLLISFRDQEIISLIDTTSKISVFPSRPSRSEIYVNCIHNLSSRPPTKLISFSRRKIWTRH